MTRGHPVGRAALGVSIAMMVMAVLSAVQASALLAVNDTAETVSGKAPKLFQGLDLAWYADPAESKQEGSTLPAHADVVAVGVAIAPGDSRNRRQLVGQAGKKDAVIGPATKTGKNDDVAYVVANLAGKVPGKLKSDVVLVVGADGAGAVPYSAAAPDSMTQGSASAHVIGRYGSQNGAPWLTGDDTLAGDLPASFIDFERKGTGAGGYDARTASIYTSFILPKEAHNLVISVYTTEGDTFQIDMIPGPARTHRIPARDGAAAPVTCARIDTHARHDETGALTGVFDVRVTLEQPVNGVAPSSPHVLAFEVDPGAASTADEVQPESPPASGVTYWQGTVDTGSPDGGTFDVTTPGAWDVQPEEPRPAASAAFAGVRIFASPDSGGTAYGDPACGSFFHLEGCAFGGDVDFWGDFAEALEQPRPTGALRAFPYTAPLGTAYCVIGEEGQEPYAVFGIEPRPFTLDGHVRDMEANLCDQTPIEFGFGGVLANCEDGAMTVRWLETGLDPTPGAEPGWGFRPEFTILPAGRQALGWSDQVTSLTPQAYERVLQEARTVLAESGWTGGEDGFDFSRPRQAPDTGSNDFVTE